MLRASALHSRCVPRSGSRQNTTAQVKRHANWGATATPAPSPGATSRRSAGRRLLHDERVLAAGRQQALEQRAQAAQRVLRAGRVARRALRRPRRQLAHVDEHRACRDVALRVRSAPGHARAGGPLPVPRHRARGPPPGEHIDAASCLSGASAHRPRMRCTVASTPGRDQRRRSASARRTGREHRPRRPGPPPEQAPAGPSRPAHRLAARQAVRSCPSLRLRRQPYPTLSGSGTSGARGARLHELRLAAPELGHDARALGHAAQVAAGGRRIEAHDHAMLQ